MLPGHNYKCRFTHWMQSKVCIYSPDTITSVDLPPGRNQKCGYTPQTQLQSACRFTPCTQIKSVDILPRHNYKSRLIHGCKLKLYIYTLDTITSVVSTHRHIYLPPGCIQKCEFTPKAQVSCMHTIIISLNALSLPAWTQPLICCHSMHSDSKNE